MKLGANNLFARTPMLLAEHSQRRESAVLPLNLDVSFLAASSTKRPSLADPLLSFLVRGSRPSHAGSVRSDFPLRWAAGPSWRTGRRASRYRTKK